jgi:hypothetical protein
MSAAYWRHIVFLGAQPRRWRQGDCEARQHLGMLAKYAG